MSQLSLSPPCLVETLERLPSLNSISIKEMHGLGKSSYCQGFLSLLSWRGRWEARVMLSETSTPHSVHVEPPIAPCEEWGLQGLLRLTLLRLPVAHTVLWGGEQRAEGVPRVSRGGRCCWQVHILGHPS